MTSASTTARRLHVVTTFDDAAWDALVARAEGGTFCHLSGWRNVIARAMRQTPCYLAAVDGDGAMHGVLPLVRLRSAVFGTRYVSMPYLNDGGALGSAEAIASLEREAQRISGGRLLELRIRGTPTDTDGDRRCEKVTVLLDLPSDEDALWKAFPAKLRSQIRRPQKAGLTMRFGPDQLDAFYRVWSENMRDLGTPALPHAFFRSIAEQFPEQLIVGCVYRDATPVAAGAGFLYRGEFEITWASSLRAWNREAPNMLLYWELMRHAIERGAHTFNFGRTTPGSGTHRFKLQWGGRTVPLAWRRLPVRAVNGSPGRAAELVSAGWQRLPLSVSRVLGPPVARLLPWW
ncbi:MAG: FemAB family PEP-CTERM system-associated protein [Candidatus Cloacimonetes bacterium]|jgi:serine/alanine adding enzyme|nr:FemAB family PEP-CTERM system-associated protein [Candidatus Cloacimonadota bacterium]